MLINLKKPFPFPPGNLIYSIVIQRKSTLFTLTIKTRGQLKRDDGLGHDLETVCFFNKF